MLDSRRDLLCVRLVSHTPCSPLMAAISGVSGHHPLNRRSKRANQQEKQMKKRVENVGGCI